MEPTSIEFIDSRNVSDLSAYGPARATVPGTPLSDEELRLLDAYWRASLTCASA